MLPCCQFARTSQDHPVSFPVDAERLPLDLPGQIEGLLGHAVAGQLAGVFGYPLLERLEYLRRGMEEAVGGYQPFDALVRALQIVVVDPEPAAAWPR